MRRTVSRTALARRSRAQTQIRPARETHACVIIPRMSKQDGRGTPGGPASTAAWAAAAAATSAQSDRARKHPTAQPQNPRQPYGQPQNPPQQSPYGQPQNISATSTYGQPQNPLQQPPYGQPQNPLQQPPYGQSPQQPYATATQSLSTTPLTARIHNSPTHSHRIPISSLPTARRIRNSRGSRRIRSKNRPTLRPESTTTAVRTDSRSTRSRCRMASRRKRSRPQQPHSAQQALDAQPRPRGAAGRRRSPPHPSEFSDGRAAQRSRLRRDGSTLAQASVPVAHRPQRDPRGRAPHHGRRAAADHRRDPASVPRVAALGAVHGRAPDDPRLDPPQLRESEGPREAAAGLEDPDHTSASASRAGFAVCFCGRRSGGWTAWKRQARTLSWAWLIYFLTPVPGVPVSARRPVSTSAT